MPNTIGSPLFEISCVFVGINHVARRIVNANHSVVSAAARQSHARVESDPFGERNLPGVRGDRC